jgi:cyanophycin synthetase
MLVNRTVQAAVIETSPRCILSEGLPYDRCQVGVVMGMPGPEGLSDLYVTDAEQMPNIVRTQVDLVLPQGATVLNADDSAVLDLADYSDGEVLLYSEHADSAALAPHRANKGRVVMVKEGAVVLAQGPEEAILVRLSDLTWVQAIQKKHLEARPHILAAAATAWALGVPVDLIRAGLLRFEGSQAGLSVH